MNNRFVLVVKCEPLELLNEIFICIGRTRLSKFDIAFLKDQIYIYHSKVEDIETRNQYHIPSDTLELVH